LLFYNAAFAFVAQETIGLIEFLSSKLNKLDLLCNSCDR